MRTLRLAAVLVAAALASTSAPSQVPGHEDQASQSQPGGTHDRDTDLIWNLIGCIGLFGLLGLWRPSDNDGYTDDPI